jgi:hypothetical protein
MFSILKKSDALQLILFLVVFFGTTIAVISVSAMTALMLAAAVLFGFVVWILMRDLELSSVQRGEPGESFISGDRRVSKQDKRKEPKVMDVPSLTRGEEEKRARQAARFGWLPVLVLLTVVPLFLFILFLYSF